MTTPQQQRTQHLLKPALTRVPPDTGVEGVAALAGIAVVAGGALVISRKRK